MQMASLSTVYSRSAQDKKENISSRRIQESGNDKTQQKGLQVAGVIGQYQKVHKTFLIGKSTRVSLGKSKQGHMSPLGTCTHARADFAVSSSGALVQLEEKIVSVAFPNMKRFRNLLVAEQQMSTMLQTLPSPSPVSCLKLVSQVGVEMFGTNFFHIYHLQPPITMRRSSRTATEKLERGSSILAT